VRVLSGRYGPYIKHGATNANVPRGTDPQAVTLEQAVTLLAERVAKGGGKGKRKPARTAKAPAAEGAKAPARKKPTKKAAKKKATA
jgi:DNA topoisomerase-1